MEAGVPQGAVLSPFLYNIYVSDSCGHCDHGPEQERPTPDPLPARGDHSIGEMVQQMEDWPKRGENVGYSLQKKTKDEDTPNRTWRNSKLWKTLRLEQRWTLHGTSETWTSSEVHHRNRKDQAGRSSKFQKAESSKNQLLREAVNYKPEIEAPHKRHRYQLLDNGWLLISFSSVSDKRQFRTNQPKKGENPPLTKP